MAVMKILLTGIVGLCLVTFLGATPLSLCINKPVENCKYHWEEREVGDGKVDKVWAKNLSSCETSYEVCCCDTIECVECGRETTTTPEPECIKKPVEHCKYHWELRENENGIIDKVWAKIPSSCETSYVETCEK